ncbi:MAG: MJ0042-type zinc finger domain-containing protein, partial [Phenylobacterium sp.]
MILTCPNCSARYAVSSGDLPESGRLVRCVSCGHKWRASPADAN